MDETRSTPIAVNAALWTTASLLWAALKAAETVDKLRHRARVRDAVRQGWTEPTMSANWHTIDNGTSSYRLVGHTYIPDRGIPISQWAAHAKDVQRKVEQAWLAGIARDKVTGGDARGPGYGPESRGDDRGTPRPSPPLA